MPDLRSKWGRFLLRLRIAGLVAWCAWLLRTRRTLPEVAARVLGPVCPGAADAETQRLAARAAKRVLSAWWMPARRVCLYRALVLGRIFRQQGLDARLNVCLTDLDRPRAGGHAWLTVDDDPLYEPEGPETRRFRGSLLGQSDLVSYWLAEPAAAGRP